MRLVGVVICDDDGTERTVMFGDVAKLSPYLAVGKRAKNAGNLAECVALIEALIPDDSFGVPAEVLARKVAEAGHSARTYRRARAKLGIKTVKYGDVWLVRREGQVGRRPNRPAA